MGGDDDTTLDNNHIGDDSHVITGDAIPNKDGGTIPTVEYKTRPPRIRNYRRAPHNDKYIEDFTISEYVPGMYCTRSI